MIGERHGIISEFFFEIKIIFKTSGLDNEKDKQD